MSTKVLIVDDDRVILFLHQIIIKDSGFTNSPVTFENGKDALNYLIEQFPDQKTVIFLDLNMPVMGGWELLDALNKPEYLNYISVVLVTSSIDPKDRQKAKEYPMVRQYIEKPMSIEVCKNIIKNHI